MLLVMVGGYLVYHLSSKEDAPSREFTELEFAGADPDHTGSCYSLDTVLFANRAANKAVRTWTSPREGTWTLSLDDVVQGYGGPQSIFQKLTFEKHGDQIHLVSVEASEKISTDLKSNIDELVDGPSDLRSTPIERCQKEGAKSYRFRPSRR
jgi:hypothetical protein